MKTLKVIGGALLLLILIAGTGFAQSAGLNIAKIKIGELKSKLTNLKNAVDNKKIAYDAKINTLLTTPHTTITQLSDAEDLIDALETEIQRLTAPDCIKDHPFQAETECPFYMQLYSGVEFIGSNEFAESFARGGIQLRNSPWEWSDNKRISFLVDLALTSRVVQTQISPSIFETEGAKALGGRMGIMIDLLNPSTSFPGTEDYTVTNTIALLADLGFDSVENLSSSSAPNENPSDLLQHHFVGLRFYHRGKNQFNGAYADIGWGISENFLENESKRFKVRGYLPIMINKKNQFKLVAMIEVDSDFKDGPDETKLIIGGTVDPKIFFKIPGLNWFSDYF